MLPQELRALWTWHEKEDTNKHHENYRTIKGRVSETQVRLESPLEVSVRVKAETEIIYFIVSFLGLPSIGWTVSFPCDCYAKGHKYGRGDKYG